MEIDTRFLSDFTAWSNHFDAPQQETALIPLAETTARKLLEAAGLPVTDNVISLAVDIALAENAERIQAALNQNCKELVQAFLNSAEFQALSIKDLDECKTVIHDVGNRCEESCLALASQYVTEVGSPTLKLLKIGKIADIYESFMFNQLNNSSAEDMKTLLATRTEFYAKVQTNVMEKLQALRDSRVQGSSKLTTIVREALRENAPNQVKNAPKKVFDEVQDLVIEAVLMALGVDLTSYIETWLKQIQGGIFQGETRTMILAAGTYSDPPLDDSVLAELRTVLNVSEVIPTLEEFNVGLDGFQTNIPLQEKYFSLLSIALFFSGVYQTIGSGEHQRYHPNRRNLCRALVIRLFPGEKFPVNDWVLIHHIEVIIGLFLLKQETAPAPQLFLEEWNSHKGCFEDKITIFDFVPLTPSLYPNLHVTIVVSGWMSKDSDMFENWKDVVTHLHYGAVYALNWDGGTEVADAAKGTLEVAAVAATAFIPVIGLAVLPIAIYGFWKEQPFKQAAQRAEETGRCLAEHIRRGAFGNATVTLLGFSLGARVIAYCLSALAQEPDQYIQDVVLFGGAVENSGWEERKRAVSGRVYNAFSDNDSVLKYAYRAAMLDQPVGLGPIDVPGIINQEMQFVDGHMDHKRHFDQSLKTVTFEP